ADGRAELRDDRGARREPGVDERAAGEELVSPRAPELVPEPLYWISW
ncbi:MAG: hypothetical protein AVDCRST_MAG78-1616, partial [uncultured Rubrobacteraceae bacterium]